MTGIDLNLRCARAARCAWVKPSRLRDHPLVVLLDQDRAGQPLAEASSEKMLTTVGASADLAVDALQELEGGVTNLHA